jgi:hypothetical protein
MSESLIFSLAGVLSFAGWATLLVSPLMPQWSDRIAGWVVPGMLAGLYVTVAVALPGEAGGFSSFAEVRALFAQPGPLLAGWIHFLAFDLVVGAWICRLGRARGIPFWLVLPCLPVVFLLGPAGFLLFAGLALVHARLGHGAATAP